MLVECPKRSDGQDWDGSHLLELLRKCDILIAASASRCASVQEDDGFTVRVRLYSHAAPENNAWGEEAADSLEAASMMVEDLAAEFSILAAQIKIDILMLDPRAGTRH